MEEVKPLISQNGFGHYSEAAGSGPQPPNLINNSSSSEQDIETVEVVDEAVGMGQSLETQKVPPSSTGSSLPLKQDFAIVEIVDKAAGMDRSLDTQKEPMNPTNSSLSSIVDEAAGTDRSFETPNKPLSSINSFLSSIEVDDEAADTDQLFEIPNEPLSSTNSSPSPSGRMVDHKVRNRLYMAALTGDWNRVKYKSVDVRSVNDRGDTALHIAAAAQQTTFVKKMVEKLSSSELASTNAYGYRAICIAAISGTVKIAKIMVDKDPSLLQTRGYNDCIPLCLAMTHKRKDMVYYLLSVTHLPKLPGSEKFKLLLAAILGDYYDIGLKIIELKPKLALRRTEDNQTALHMLARKPHAIHSRSQQRKWSKYNNSFWFKRIFTKTWMKTLAYRMVEIMWETVLESLRFESKVLEFINTPSRLLHDAAEVGNVEFLIVLIRLYPDVIWNLDSSYRSIFHVAVENRQENVFRLIYEIGGLKDIIANSTGPDNVTILHLAACQASPNHLDRVSGPALQMQREVQWFKEVEKIAAPCLWEVTNTSSKERPIIVKGEITCLTLQELFTKNHIELQKQGEKWMKSTSNSCMLVAALVSTVVFAAAFTVPGGNNQSTGVPVFKNKNLFSVFVVADAAALFSSSISIMIFLSILTSRFAQEDFLNSLPWRLLIGLATLFVSLACMVVAFSATFFMLYDARKSSIPWAVAAMAVAPVTCFTVLQYKLWADTFRATFWSKYLFKPRQPSLNRFPPPLLKRNLWLEHISKKSH